MRLTTVLLIATLMQASAIGFAQKISIHKTNVPLVDVITELRKQSGFNFIVPGDLLSKAKPVSVVATNTDFKVVLDQIFANQPIAYQINNNTVTLRVKPSTVLDRLTNWLQAIEVTGTVIDSASKKPLPGATIVVKGKNLAVRSGADGSFKIQNVEEDATLIIRYTGYKAKEVRAARSLGAIGLVLDVAELEEVGVSVNTGYQRIKPEQSTGAVAQIGTKEYESRMSTNFIDGLVNRLPGLMINNNVNFVSTVPGATGSSSRPLFNIRGISTMSANQNPLIVVDGYPTELTLDMIDPNEIKSVTILKDAAAATVYGVRASNGVIVIERKQATIGKPMFTYRTTLGITPKEDYSRYRWAKDASAIATNYWRTTQSAIVNASSWGLLSGAAAGSVRRSAPYYIAAQAAAQMITPAQAEAAYAALAGYDNLEDYTDLFLRTANTMTHNLNVSGGNNNALYYITANYTGNRSNQILNDNNRFSLSGRTTLKLSRRLGLELTTDYQEQRFNGAPVPNVNDYMPYERYTDATGLPTSIIGVSIAPAYNTYIMSQGLEDDAVYPVIDVNEISSTTRTVNNRTTANFKYDLGKGFDLLFGGIYETSRTELRYLASERSSVVKQYINDYANRQADGTLKFNIPKGGYLRQNNANTSSYTGRMQLNFNRQFGKHTINAIMGGEIRNLINRSNLTTSFGYNDETLLQQGVDYASIVSGAAATRGSYGLGSSITSIEGLFNQQYIEDRFLSGFANLVYSYKNTYSLTGSMRIDQSNLFGTNPKYKYKPLWSVGAAWNIHREAFMQNVSWVDQLKLRASYGFNGNVAKLSLPQVIAQARINNTISPASPSLRLLSYANSSLRWEQTKNINAGVDFSIFKNIYGNIYYYQKNSTDLLGNALIDPTLGISPTLINQANIRNNGIELGLRADWIARRNFNWNTGIVVSRNSSKVLDVFRRGDFNPQTLNALGYVKGYPVGAMFGYNTIGLNPTTGLPIILDANGNINQTNNNALGSPQTAAMASETAGLTHYAGSSIPTINAGLSNRIDVGSFYFFAMINYYGGFNVRVPRADPRSVRPFEGAGNYWRVPGDELNTDVMALAGFAGANANNAYNYADQYIVHGDYITLGDVTASYSFDKVRFLKKAGFTNFELKLQASNLYTVGFNRYNFSMATGGFAKSYLTPTYTIGLFTNF